MFNDVDKGTGHPDDPNAQEVTVSQRHWRDPPLEKGFCSQQKESICFQKGNSTGRVTTRRNRQGKNIGTLRGEYPVTPTRVWPKEGARAQALSLNEGHQRSPPLQKQQKKASQDEDGGDRNTSWGNTDSRG